MTTAHTRRPVQPCAGQAKSDLARQRGRWRLARHPRLLVGRCPCRPDPIWLCAQTYPDSTPPGSSRARRRFSPPPRAQTGCALRRQAAGPGIDRLPSPSSPSALASSLALLLRVRSPSHFSLRSASRRTPRERAAAWMIVDASSTTAAAGGAAAGAGRDGCGRSRSLLARRPYARLAVDDRPPVWPTGGSGIASRATGPVRGKRRELNLAVGVDSTSVRAKVV